jgi:hypothetical protein
VANTEAEELMLYGHLARINWLFSCFSGRKIGLLYLRNSFEGLGNLIAGEKENFFLPDS